MLDIVQSFTLLSYCIVSPIYISPICNVEIHYYEKIKLGILYFSLFTWYQSQERKPNFLGDRVSFRLPFPSPDLLLTTAFRRSRRRPPPSAAVRRRHCRRRLPGKLFSGRKPHSSKRRGPIYTPVATPPESDLPRAVTRVFLRQPRRPRAGACVRVWARGSFSGDAPPQSGSSGAVLVF